MKTAKRLISLLLMVAMVFTAFPASAFAGEAAANTVGQLAAESQIEMPFTDVKKGDWYYDAIEYAYKNGIFNGTDEHSFDPGGAVTRAMYVTVMGRFAGIDPAKYSGTDTGFKDVAADAYYAPYVAWAAEKGITGGVGNQRFDTDGLVTREQMAVFTHRFFEVYAVDYQSNAKTPPADLDQVASWAKEAVHALWNAGIFNGDGNGRFQPQKLASRAEAATFLRNTDDKTDAKGIESSGGGAGGGNSGDKTPPISGDDTYTVTFVANGGTEIAPIRVTKGTAIPNFPTPSKAGHLFIGWYLEDTFSTQFFENDVVSRNLTLYARYETFSTGSNDIEQRIGSYRIAEEDPVGADYSVDVSASGKDTAYIRQQLRLDSNSDVDGLTVSQSGDTFTVSMSGGFKAGMSYTLVLLDDTLTFSGKDAQVRELSFSIVKEQVDNLSLNDEMKYIQLAVEAKEITLNGAVVEGSLSEAVFKIAKNMPDNGVSPVGTFVYNDASSLETGDLICLYKNKKPAKGVTDEELAGDDIAYVKVTSIDSNKVTFSIADPTEVLALPTTAIVSKNDITALSLTDPTNKTPGQDFSFTVDTNQFDTMAVGESDFTKRELKNGDIIVIYDGPSILHASEERTILGIVESISPSEGTLYTVMAKTTTMEQLQNTALDYYQTTPVDALPIGDITNEIETQITNDEVVEKLARSYAEMILAGSLLDDFSDGAPVGVQMTDGSFADITALASAGGSGKSVKFEPLTPAYLPRIAYGEAYGPGAYQVEAQIKLKISFIVKEGEDGNPDQTVNVTFTVDFTEELHVSINTSVDMEWGTRFLFVPWIKYCYVNADLDIKTRTEVNFKAELKTNDGVKAINLDISDDIKEWIGIGEEDEREVEKNVALIYKRYQELVDTEMSFVRTFEKELYKTNIPIVKFVLSIDLVVNAFEEISATAVLFADIEFKEGTRHSFYADLIGGTIRYQKSQLFADSLEFNVELIGRLRWRAGIEASAALVVFKDTLASISITIAAGPYFDWFGFFNYHYKKVGGVINDSRMGAMYMEAGLYLEAGAQIKAAGKYAVNVGFVDEEWPLWSSNSKDFVYDFSYKLADGEQFIINNKQTDLPSYALKMIQLDLKDGKSYLKNYGASSFDIVFSNNAFSLSDGKINVATNDMLAVSDMTIIWKGGPLAFTSFPIKRTFRVIYSTSGTPTPMGALSVTVNGKAVWSERVALDTPYSEVLPSQEEILELIGYAGYNDAQYGNLLYTGTGDYAVNLDGKVEESRNFEYTIPVREYSVTVSGVQNANGTTRTETIKAPYGGTFDFRPINNTGTSIKGETYTKFKAVETVGEKGISLHTNMERDLALQILNGTHTYQATYVDNSNTVQYVFLTLEGSIAPVSGIIERNTVPDFNYLAHMETAEVGEGNTGYRLFQLDGDITSPVTKDRTIYITAVPSNGYDLFYVSNGGKWAESYEAPTYYKPVESAEDEGATTLPTYDDIVRADGYAFAGWYDNSGFSGNPVTTAVGNQGPMTYYALWVAPEYTIRFFGAGQMEEIPTTFGAAVTLPNRTVELKAFREQSGRFMGWNTRADGTGIAYEGNAEFDIPTGVSPDGVLTLYAHYEDFMVAYAPTNPEAPVPTGTMALCSALYYNSAYPGTITMQGDIETIYDEIVLPDGTTFSGGGYKLKSYVGTVFSIAEGNTVKLENVKLSSSSNNFTGPKIDNSGNLTIENAEMSGTSDDRIIYNREGGKMVLRNLTLENSSHSGGILDNDGTVVLDNCLSKNSMRGQITNTGQMVLNNVNFNTNGYPAYYPGTISNVGGELYLLNTSVLHNNPYYSYVDTGNQNNGAVQSTGGTLYIVNSLLGGNTERNIRINSADTNAHLLNSISGPIDEESAKLPETSDTLFLDDDEIVYAEEGWAGSVWHNWNVIIDDPALKNLAATIYLDYSDLDNIKIGFSFNGIFTPILNDATEETPTVEKYYGGADRDLNNNRVGAEYVEIQQD